MSAQLVLRMMRLTDNRRTWTAKLGVPGTDAEEWPLSTVGDWLDAEGASATDVNPLTIVEQFAIANIGPFPGDTAYTQHRMAEPGWPHAPQSAGSPARYLDTAAINRD